MKLPRRQFLHLAAGAAALPAVSGSRWAQAYPTRPVRLVAPFPPGGSIDLAGAPDRSMAVGAARSAIRRREPAGCRRQHRQRGGPELATRRLYAPVVQRGERDQRRALRQAQLQFPRYRAGRRHQPRTQCHGGLSIGSGEDLSRVHRLCQGQSWQDQYGVVGHRHVNSYVRRAVQADDRGRHAARALSWLGADAHRSPRRASPGRLRQLQPSMPHIRAGKLRALAVTTSRRSEALPELPTVGDFVPGYEASTWNGVCAPKNTPAEIVDRLNREINAGLADPRLKTRLAEMGAWALQVHPPIAAS